MFSHIPSTVLNSNSGGPLFNAYHHKPHATVSLPTYVTKHKRPLSSDLTFRARGTTRLSISARSLPQSSRRPKSVDKVLSDFSGSLKSVGSKDSVWYTWNSWLRETLEFFPTTSLRARVQQAMKEGKIFQIKWGGWHHIRRALIRRGWVEKPRLSLGSFTPETTLSGEIRSMPLLGSHSGHNLDKNILWTMTVFENCRPNLVWNMGYFNPKSMRRGQLINRQPKPLSSFHTKVGMVLISQSLHWHQEENVARTNIPRSYRLYVPEERASFVGDYYLTACVALLQWLVASSKHGGSSTVMEKSGTVNTKCIHNAVSKLNRYVRRRQHGDIDTSRSSKSDRSQEEDPENLLVAHWKLIYGREMLSIGSDSYDTLCTLAKSTLKVVTKYLPQTRIDGVHNLWICKPGYQMRGEGVTVLNDLRKILRLLDTKVFKGNKADWVVQKYIERPFLIFNTKFDIRQWFLVTSFNPLTVWFYRDSYLRFCSKPFALEDFDERIHLCNSSVQRKYTMRHKMLPDDKIWDHYTFLAYLESKGKMNVWDDIILPGMKQALLGVLLTSQETLTDCPQTCFQLYGADFMLSHDFTPWLIEINNLPLLSSQCPTLARMSRAVLEDLIKVVIDYRQNPSSHTGLFQLIFQQQHLTPHTTGSPIVVVKGKKVRLEAELINDVQSSEFKFESEPSGINLTPLKMHTYKSDPLLLSQRFQLQDPPRAPINDSSKGGISTYSTLVQDSLTDITETSEVDMSGLVQEEDDGMEMEVGSTDVFQQNKMTE